MFTLHPQLEADTIMLGDFPLCRLLLMNDAAYPWFILVPRREDIREIFELDEADQAAFLQESTFLARRLSEVFAADKINVAALGNLVPQLHVHHIVRYHDDPAWPAPVWGKAPARPYTPKELAAMLLKVGLVLGEGAELVNEDEEGEDRT
ncbi:HIT domain-containing protein [Geoalkalibacter halelectricus]|uniref:HIT domain-containing protein n=1 Tax=Geoalkalibacter halelectricus TaxID=2847045 RepID=UPI0021B492EF|nr:HIT domain-containing protein [Geoalkalibacter halelectricus]MDO3377877.1 HIT domain-containing protein [Geoalkalibacter halelectricus]